MSSSTYYQNQQPSDSIEKRIRESRKKEVIMKLNELNTKLSPNISLSQQSLFQHRYKDYLTTIRSPPTKSFSQYNFFFKFSCFLRDYETPSYTTSNFKFPEERLEKSTLFTKKFQPNNANNNFSNQTPLPTENKESRKNDENIVFYYFLND